MGYGEVCLRARERADPGVVDINTSSMGENRFELVELVESMRRGRFEGLISGGPGALADLAAMTDIAEPFVFATAAMLCVDGTCAPAWCCVLRREGSGQMWWSQLPHSKRTHNGNSKACLNSNLRPSPLGVRPSPLGVIGIGTSSSSL